MGGSRPAALILMVLAVLLAAAAPSGRQAVTLSGTVVDTAGQPVASQEVLLHRVAGQEGARIGQAVSDRDGVFRFTFTAQPAVGAVYFATARYNGQVYIGPFIELPVDSSIAYRVVVGGEPVSFDAAPPTGIGAEVRPPASPRRWALAVIPLIGMLAVATAALLSRRGRRDRRHLLIRLAVLEEDAAKGETEGLRRERERLLERLGGGPGA